jgi:hypothetical protein
MTKLLSTIKPELHPDCGRGEELIVSMMKGYQDLIRKLPKGGWFSRLAVATARRPPILTLCLYILLPKANVYIQSTYIMYSSYT